MRLSGSAPSCRRLLRTLAAYSLWAAAPRPSRRQWLALLLLACVVCLPALRFSRQPYPPLTRLVAWDDYHLLKGLDAGHGWRDALGWLQGDWPEGNGFYRPLAALSLWGDYLLWGWNPLGYRVTQWLLYAATGAALAALVSVLSGRREYALGTLLCFGFMPQEGGITVLMLLNTRPEALCGLFMLLTAYCTVRYVRFGEAGALGAALAGGALALGSKEMAMMLPALALVCATAARRPKRMRRGLALTVGLVAVTALWYCVYQVSVPGRLPLPGSPAPPILPHNPWLPLQTLCPDLIAWRAFCTIGINWVLLITPWVMKLEVTTVLWLIAAGLLLHHAPRVALWVALWAPLTWVPLLSVHIAIGHYHYIPQLAFFAGAGTALLLATRWLAKELQRLGWPTSESVKCGADL